MKKTETEFEHLRSNKTEGHRHSASLQHNVMAIKLKLAFEDLRIQYKAKLYPSRKHSSGNSNLSFCDVQTYFDLETGRDRASRGMLEPVFGNCRLSYPRG
mmetsp:Transcript_21761/g.47346  ORF Transcript_21761/g.47346 Transcript_21761/m.47346 type:complete len:100 (+) Transcript_21761:1014-1313(+)